MKLAHYPNFHCILPCYGLQARKQSSPTNAHIHTHTTKGKDKEEEVKIYIIEGVVWKNPASHFPTHLPIRDAMRKEKKEKDPISPKQRKETKSQNNFEKKTSVCVYVCV